MASISVKNVTLRYPVFDSERSFRKELFSRHVGGTIGQGDEEKQVHVTALQDINLELKDGDRLGLVGHNGAGKTTLIKLLGGVFEPTLGSIEITGQSAALVTMGIGIDYDDTGYQNIANCGFYLGMTPDEVEENTAEIAEFTELGDFLRLPVKTYSSGMVTRLTFAITTAVAPEIILMDEGIGAGDARFVTKAKERLDDMIHRSSVMVLASHSTSLIKELCNGAAILAHGEIISRGSVDDILEEYDELSRSEG